jgi:hypothetical protein
MKNIFNKFFFESTKYLHKLFFLAFLLSGILASVKWMKTLDPYTGLIYLALLLAVCWLYFCWINNKKIR